MTKVYEVVHSDHDMHDTHGIFSTREQAERAAAVFGPDLPGGSVYVREHELDPDIWARADDAGEFGYNIHFLHGRVSVFNCEAESDMESWTPYDDSDDDNPIVSVRAKTYAEAVERANARLEEVRE